MAAHMIGESCMHADQERIYLFNGQPADAC